MRTLTLTVWLLVLASPPQVWAAPQVKPMDQGSACALLKKREAKAASIPETGPVGLGWFCDFHAFEDSRDHRWFLIALRSNRQCDGPCSNLMGWFAIDRHNGTIHSFNMAEYAVGPAIKFPD